MPDRPTVLQSAAAKVLQRYWRLSRGLRLGVRALLLDEQDRILLIRDSSGGGRSLPGGEVGANETVATALARHLNREPGIALEDAPDLIGFCSPAGERHYDHIALLFVHHWRWRDGASLGDAAFFPRDALPEDTLRSTITIIAEFDPISRRSLPSDQ